MTIIRGLLKMAACVVGDADERQHDGHFDEDPDDGCQCGPGLQTEKRDCNGHGKLEEIACAYQAGRGGYAVGQFPGSRPTVGDEEYQDGLQNKRYRYQQDMNRIGKNRISLECKKDNERQKKADGGKGSEFAYKLVVEIVDAPALHNYYSGYDCRHKRNDDEQRDREDECCPGYGDAADAEQKADNRHKSHKDNKVVDGDLNERIGCVASRQIAPNKHHRRAGGSPEKHRSGKILVGQPDRYQMLENNEEEKPSDAEHRERFYEPVGDTCDQNAFRTLAYVHHALEVDLQHHGVDHHPNQDGDRYRHIGVFPLAERSRESRDEIADSYARYDAKRDPNAQIFLKKTYRPDFIVSLFHLSSVFSGCKFIKFTLESVRQSGKFNDRICYFSFISLYLQHLTIPAYRTLDSHAHKS